MSTTAQAACAERLEAALADLVRLHEGVGRLPGIEPVVEWDCFTALEHLEEALAALVRARAVLSHHQTGGRT